MKKAALLCALLGAIFISGCAKQESATTETTESAAPAAAEDAAAPAADAAAPAADAAATTSTAQ